MKQLMVANMRKKHKNYDRKSLETILKAQIENSLELGWRPEQLIFLSNFDFEFMGVQLQKIDLNAFCWTGSKMFGLKWLFDNNRFPAGEIVWAKDLDTWQNIWFDAPDIRDVGATYYSRPKFNCGSVFWGPGSQDIISEVVKRLEENKEIKEEPVLNKMFKSNDYKDRVTVLNTTYNVGCSGFVPRYERATKPIKVCHFHPTNKIAWETHVLDRNGLDEGPVTLRLERLVRKYYPENAVELSDKGKKKADMLRKKRLEEKK